MSARVAMCGGLALGAAQRLVEPVVAALVEQVAGHPLAVAAGALGVGESDDSSPWHVPPESFASGSSAPWYAGLAHLRLRA